MEKNRVVSVDWSVIHSANKRAVKHFVEGNSLRSVVDMVRSSQKAVTEVYKAEKYLSAKNARQRAKRFLSRS